MKLFTLIFISSFLVKAEAYSTPFVSFKSGFTKTDKLEITNMPPVRSQDGLGICYSFTAATLLEYSKCRTTKDCSTLSDKQRVSVLDLARFGNPVAQNEDATDYFNYQKLAVGGNPVLCLYNVVHNVQSVACESCAPFQALMSLNADNPDLQKEAVATLESKFNKIKNKETDCFNCIADDIKAIFPFSASKENIKVALGESDYEGFLNRLLVPDACYDPKERITPVNSTVKVFPEAGKKTNYSELLATIKNNLKKENPMILNGICCDEVDSKSTADCKEVHSVVITGSARLCDKNNKCYDALKVHNSWGKEWQDKNNDGWVLADELLNRSHYEEGALTWLENK